MDIHLFRLQMSKSPLLVDFGQLLSWCMPLAELVISALLASVPSFDSMTGDFYRSAFLFDEGYVFDKEIYLVGVNPTRKHRFFIQLKISEDSVISIKNFPSGIPSFDGRFVSLLEI